MSEHVLSISQFNNFIKNIFVQETMLFNISIYGEVGQISVSERAVYFTLKDESALLNCVIFGNYAGYLFKEGELVTVRGTPSYYTKNGKFSFNVNKVEPYGEGLIYKNFLELKRKLESLGLFDSKNKKAIPKYIEKIGVATSEKGAVIHDIIDIAHRRNPNLNILLCPTKVQGIDAEKSIVRSIKRLDETDVDVIILARGGGSNEDLSAFNNEEVAMTVFNAKKPIISAVGHETDFTLADFAADLRVPTPSAAAEIIAVDLTQIRQLLSQKISSILRAVNGYYDTKAAKLFNRFDDISYKTGLYFDAKTDYIETVSRNIVHSAEIIVTRAEHKFELMTNRLNAVNPLQILKKGYTRVYKANKLVKKIDDVEINDKITVIMQNGKLNCQILDKSEEI